MGNEDAKKAAAARKQARQRDKLIRGQVSNRQGTARKHTGSKLRRSKGGRGKT